MLLGGFDDPDVPVRAVAEQIVSRPCVERRLHFCEITLGLDLFGDVEAGIAQASHDVFEVTKPSQPTKRS
jgi:hypothetical protein